VSACSQRSHQRLNVPPAAPPQRGSSLASLRAAGPSQQQRTTGPLPAGAGADRESQARATGRNEGSVAARRRARAAATPTPATTREYAGHPSPPGALPAETPAPSPASHHRVPRTPLVRPVRVSQRGCVPSWHLLKTTLSRPSPGLLGSAHHVVPLPLPLHTHTSSVPHRAPSQQEATHPLDF